MSLARIVGAGIDSYIREIIDRVIVPRTEDTAFNPLRRDRVNERVFDRVIERFGPQSRYDRGLIRDMIETERVATNAARRDERAIIERERRERENPPLSPPPPPPPAPPPAPPPPGQWEADVIIKVPNASGEVLRGRVRLTDLQTGDSNEVLKRLQDEGLYEQLLNDNGISWGKRGRPLGQTGTIDVVIKSKRKMK